MVEIPLWGTLVMLAIGKKVAVLGAAKFYGFHRIYRHSRKAIRRTIRSKDSKVYWENNLRYAFRLPERVLLRLRGDRTAGAHQGAVSIEVAHSAAVARFGRHTANGEVPAPVSAAQPIHAAAVVPFPAQQPITASFASSPLLAQSLARGRARLQADKAAFLQSHHLRSQHLRLVGRRLYDRIDDLSVCKQPYNLIPSI